MPVNIDFDEAIAAVSQISRKPMQGTPTIKEDDEKDLPLVDGEWDEDVLGTYNPRTVCITLYTKAIQQASCQLQIAEEDLCMVVLLHELGHWIWHMALDDKGNNWQNYGEGVPDCRETLAQLCVCWASNAECLQPKKKQIIKALFALMKKQSQVYQLDENHEQTKLRKIPDECFREIREMQYITIMVSMDEVTSCIEAITLREM